MFIILFLLTSVVSLVSLVHAYEIVGDAFAIERLMETRDSIVNKKKTRRILRESNEYIAFNAFDKVFEIELIHVVDNQELFSEDFRAYNVSPDGSVHEVMIIERNCIMEGRVRNYNGVHKNYVTLSFCHGLVIGSIHAFDEEYLLNPQSSFKEASKNQNDDKKSNSKDETTVISRRRDLESIKNPMACASDGVAKSVPFDPEKILAEEVEIAMKTVDVKQNDVNGGGAKTKYVKLALISDFERFILFGSRRSRILASALAIAFQIKNIYLNFPLSSGYNIRIQITSFVSFETANPWGSLSKTSNGEIDPSLLLSKFNSWRTSALNSRILPQETIAHLLSGHNFLGDTVGLASLSQACSNYYGSGVNQAISTIDQFVGKIVAHELGHNLGMRHTNEYIAGTAINTPDLASSCAGTYNVMSPMLLSGVGTFTWDKCSIAWFKMFLRGYPYDCTDSGCYYPRGYGSSTNPTLCLEEKSSNPILEGIVCGDGIQEGDEQCDCGNEEQCKSLDPCCDPNTCKLTSTSRCSANDPCCDADTCDFVPASAKQVCRASKGDCDMAEFCNGASPKCPSDLFKPLGKTCNVIAHRDSDDANGITRKGICYKGECLSHESQCISLSEKGLYSDIDGECSRAGDDDGDLACSKLYCKRINTDYCGTNYYSPELAYVKDGTPCGDKRACFSQKCISYDTRTDTTNNQPTQKPIVSIPTKKPTTSSPTQRK